MTVVATVAVHFCSVRLEVKAAFETKTTLSGFSFNRFNIQIFLKNRKI